jgi:predicted alpha/beta-hydrolase family hydrolase
VTRGSGTVRSRLARADVDPVDVEVVEHVPEDHTSATLGVLLAHGAGSDLDAPVLVAAAEAIAAAGHLAVRANLGFRQRRPTGPPPRAEASIDDLDATWRALRMRHADLSWVLGGSSYGGRVASMVAARQPDVAGVLCWSYPLHPPRRPERLRVAHLPDVTASMLVVQGTHDPFGSPDELRPHLATTAGPSAIVEVAGGDHGLHVPRTRSHDGRTHRVGAVVADVAPAVTAWLSEVAARA